MIFNIIIQRLTSRLKLHHRLLVDTIIYLRQTHQMNYQRKL